MRNYAQLNISVWNDDDFRALTPPAQHLYFLLLSHPTLSYCGVGDWRPGRLARMAHGWTAGQVESAGAELVHNLFIVIDDETDEFLVRSFVRNDPLMRQRNLGVSMARAFSVVASEGIRGVVVHELKRLRDARPELKGFESDEVVSVLSKPAIDPSVYPCGDPWVDPSVEGSIDPYVDPKVDPSIDPWVRGKPNPSIDPSVYPSVDPSPTPAPTPPPLQVSELSRGREDGGKGGLGGKGETNATDSTGKTEPPQPFYENLDALAAAHTHTNPTQAFGTIDDPRCAEHKDLDRAPACWECKQAGDILKAQAEEERAARRAQIDACPHCDTNGWVIGTNPAIKCTHQPPLKAVGGPF